MFVADDRGNVVGSLGLINAQGIVEFGMQLDAEHRGAGIGGQLLAAAIDWSRSAGAHKMMLHVWPHNARAIELYSRMGFEIEGRLRRQLRRRNGELWDVMVMGLVLDTESPGSPNEDHARVTSWAR
jgi:RimJ/RimL family protein N-acetyltransferase